MEQCASAHTIPRVQGCIAPYTLQRHESRPAFDCAWQLIYKRLEAIGQLDNLERIFPAKDWQPSWHAGARTIIREEHRV